MNRNPTLDRPHGAIVPVAAALPTLIAIGILGTNNLLELCFHRHDSSAAIPSP